MVHLATLPQDGPASALDVSEATQVPVGYLQKVMRMMSRHGLLTAQRGTGGGFTLAKVPTAISVLDVLRATDTQIPRIERCPLGIKGHTRLCALHRLLDEQMANAEQVFAATSIADLVGGNDVRPLCDNTGHTPLSITARPTAPNGSGST